MTKIKQYQRNELLNSYECPVIYQGIGYQSAKHAIESQKNKKDVTYEILLCKILQNPEVAQELLDTAFTQLEDTSDLPGKTLMLIREQLRSIR